MRAVLLSRIFAVIGILILASPLAAQSSSWGVLDEIANREWTTEKEPRPRVTKFRWIEEGRVLEARHGFASRLQFGEAKFADTVQRFVLDPRTGAINVTYTYEDGRPPLKTVMHVEADGSIVETFTDAKGAKKRNIYKSPTLSLNLIERQELQGAKWASLGTTRKAGLTQAEIAENKRREEARVHLAIAQENARRAAEQARREAEIAEQEAANEQRQYEQQSMQQNMPNPLDILNGLANSINQETQRRQVDFERRMADLQAEQARRRAEEAAAQQRQADLEVDRQRSAAQQQRVADEAAERRAEEQRREAQAQRAREAEQQRLAELQRKQEEANRPIAFKEGVVACSKQRENYYRCDGPLQVTYSDLVSDSGMTSLKQACGGGSLRDLGSSGGYRVFGCGFGMHPTSDYPGNRDVAAILGIYVPGLGTYYCPPSTDAYCRGGN